MVLHILFITFFSRSTFNPNNCNITVQGGTIQASAFIQVLGNSLIVSSDLSGVILLNELSSQFGTYSTLAKLYYTYCYNLLTCKLCFSLKTSSWMMFVRLILMKIGVIVLSTLRLFKCMQIGFVKEGKFLQMWQPFTVTDRMVKRFSISACNVIWQLYTAYSCIFTAVYEYLGTSL